MTVHQSSSRCFPLLLSFATALSACSAEPDASAGQYGYTTRDSAGVTIIENSIPAWADGEGWTLSPEPLLSIGAVDGPDEYILYRSSSAIRMDDGRIVVANGGSHEIRFYDSKGVFLNASGADGEGPGEFRSAGFIWRLQPDSLAVLDFQLYRISVFDRNGEFGRVFRLEEGLTGMVFPWGMFEDGTILGQASLRDDGEHAEMGSFRDLLQTQLYDREGVLISILATLPGTELYRATLPDGSAITTGPRHGLTAWTATGPNSWFYGPSEAYELQEWGLEGNLLRVFRLDKELRPVPAQDIAEWEEAVRKMRSDRKQLWEAVPVADALPAYEQILRDRAGNLWTAEYLVLDETPVWQVLDPDGRWLGSVAMPPGGRISEIGEDYVLGTWRDDMDIETVRLYGLNKSEAP